MEKKKRIHRLDRRHIAPELLQYAWSPTERLDVAKGRIRWMDKHGTVHNIRDLEFTHLVNIHSLLSKQGRRWAAFIIAGEMHRRGQGGYPKGYEEAVQNYKRYPETPNLQIFD